MKILQQLMIYMALAIAGVGAAQAATAMTVYKSPVFRNGTAKRFSRR